MPKVSHESDTAVLDNQASSKREKAKAAHRLEGSGHVPDQSPRTVVYPELQIGFRGGDQALTAEEAKTALGWRELRRGGGEPMLVDYEDKKIFCDHNQNNRPFYMALAEKYAQEILRKRWRINGETIVVGKYGSILSGQHRLVGLILAVQAWYIDPDKYPEWQTEPILETLLAVGVEETDDVINTLDGGQERTVTDVVYRAAYFADMVNADRRACSRACETAVRMVWDRTGVTNAYGIEKTNKESIDMIDRHITLVSCVKHVFQENVKNKIGKVLAVGYSSGLCYLMAVSNTDPASYYSGNRDEVNMDFSALDRSYEFFVNLGSETGPLKVVGEVLAEMLINCGDAGLTQRERIAVVIKAWNAEGRVSPENLSLEYNTDEDGARHLRSMPTVGGIDRGESHADRPEIDELEQSEEPTTQAPKDGDDVWVREPKGSPWKGKLLRTRTAPGGEKLIAIVEYSIGEGKAPRSFECDYEWLSLEEPDGDSAS